MKPIYHLHLVLMCLLTSSLVIYGQKDQIPLDPILEEASDRDLIKIGMVSASKPAKLKFGKFSTDNRKGLSISEGDKPVELLFSFDLLNTNGDQAHVEASGSQENAKSSKDGQTANDISVYISTNLDEDDLWVLLVTKPADNKDLSIHNIFLTNGDEEITFKHVVGTPMNKSEVTAPKGIEAFIDDYPIAAMQYYSGGSFSYKKFIWISQKSEPQLQLVMAAVFSALLEIGDYFDGNGFTEN